MHGLMDVEGLAAPEGGEEDAGESLKIDSLVCNSTRFQFETALRSMKALVHRRNTCICD